MSTHSNKSPKKILRLSLLPLAVVTGLGLTLSAPPVSAQMGVATVVCTTRAGGLAGAAKSVIGGVACASEDTLLAIANALQRETIETSKVVENQSQNVSTTDLANRVATVQEKIQDSVAPYANTLSDDACRDATVAGGAVPGGMMGSGAGGVVANAAAREGASNAKQEERLLSSKTPDAVLAEIVGPKSKPFCTQADVANKVPNCTVVGAIPGANMRFSSILTAANSVPGKAGRSIPNDENNVSMIAARHYITIMSPRNAPDVPDGSKGKPEAKKFLAVQRMYNGAALSVTNFLDHSLSWTVALPSNHPYITTWKGDADLNKEYAETYPGRDKPASPSLREMMYFSIEKQNAPSQMVKDAAGKNDPVYLAYRNLELQKINAMMLLRINEQLEYNGAVQSALLRNQLDPVTYGELTTLRAAVR